MSTAGQNIDGSKAPVLKTGSSYQSGASFAVPAVLTSPEQISEHADIQKNCWVPEPLKEYARGGATAGEALNKLLESQEDRWAKHVSRVKKWDNFYLGMAAYVATASKDPSTQVGAVIVRPNNTLASVGYNGFPRGMNDDPELYADREVKYSRIVHAEMNAILNANGSVDGCTLYTSALPPCDRCAVFVVQAGIKRVVYEQPSDDVLERWADSIAKTADIFNEAGIQMRALSLKGQ